MYSFLLIAHTVTRWLVLATLLYAIARAYRGYRRTKMFSKHDNRARHWAATAAHVQLAIGVTLYFQSPLVQLYWNGKTGTGTRDALFFSTIHMLVMSVAVIIITIGSSLAKRKQTSNDKFRTMLSYFIIALIIICIAIPWPFSPFANRPYFR